MHATDERPGRVLVEACVDSVDSAVAAERGGALRVELCDSLGDGGTTPSAGMIEACVERVAVPVFVIVRPRGGEFVASAAELDVMERDIAMAGRLGARGVVVGLLRADASIDEGRMARLVERAGSLELTFHRAFDATPDLERSLDVLISLGIHRVLTSGGAPTALAGAERIAGLVLRAGEGLVVMAGGGIREEHASALVARTNVREIHVRGARNATPRTASVAPFRLRKPLPDDERVWEETDERRIRSFVTGVSAARPGPSPRR